MGGEPMLSYPDIAKSILFLESLSKSLGKSISFGMPTNATLLTRASLEFFKSHQVAVSLSIDSLSPEYDYRNIRWADISSVPTLLKNIALFQEYADILRIKIVVMPETVVYLRQNFERLRELGFNFINIQPAHGVLWSDQAREQFLTVYAELLGLARADPNLRSAVLKGSEQSDRTEVISCAKGRSEICIDSYGKVFVCDAFLAFPYPKRAQYAHDVLEWGQFDGKKFREFSEWKFCNNTILDGWSDLTGCASCDETKSCSKLCNALPVNWADYDREILLSNFRLYHEIDLLQHA
jgi:sulfatase maturation enzyme AslB (radical SAM superfamily)